MHSSSAFHPVHQCNDGLFNTASGKIISLNDPTPEMIDIQDIAGALSKICRFGGHTSAFYSVAQHSVLVASLVPDSLKKEALLHDATEAYLGDVIKPLKVLLGSRYTDLEGEFTKAISQRFNVDLEGLYPSIKWFDRKALDVEHEALQKGNMAPMLELQTDFGLAFPDQWAWDHKTAQKTFMAMYHELFNK